MSPIQEIFRTYAPEYLHRYGDRMPTEHKKVIYALQNCRSGSYGTAVYRCDQCGSNHVFPCSCGNRHCPTCQLDKAKEWLHKQLQKLLPCHYFLITVTLPKPLQRFIRSHQRSGYAAIFSCTYAALKKLAADPRFLGSSSIGFLAVLHTWGSQLQYHPHLHLIVPGGGIAPDASSWLSSRQDLFVHTKPLAGIIRAKFRDAMNSAGLLEQVDPSVWSQDWVVDTQSVGNGQTSLRYLARYLFRVAISNNRILSYDNHAVTFRYKDSASRRWRTMTLDAMEFIRRFLQHVLPAGFMKVRHYGFLNGNAALSLEKLRDLVCAFYRLLRDTLPIPVSFAPSRPRCPHCQGTLYLISFFPPLQKVVPSG
jgi:hypothetical protein